MIGLIGQSFLCTFGSPLILGASGFIFVSFILFSLCIIVLQFFSVVFILFWNVWNSGMERIK
jgi:hypothetical protein